MKGSPGISAVIFDMDGLMLDTEPLYKVAWQQASTELGYELDDTSYLKLVGRPTPDCEEELIKQFVYRPRVLGQWFDVLRIYAATSSPPRSRLTRAGLR